MYNKIVISITLIFLSSMNCTSAQGIEKNNLLENWHLDHYKIGSKEYQPSKREKNDYLFLIKDMTFSSVSAGKKETGTWKLNINGGYIVMTDNNGEKVKAYIITLTSKTLILKYDIEEIREVEVHYSNRS
ncbi:lipocalin family protein [Aquimarina sediminis]|uniref:lipocalin family protein n=1 Tax=Aquimarina sediminis TaxID=2070536 RepID=UPI000CA02ED0|nr:lipocalin family protein [Aquimarina sediminis]